MSSRWQPNLERSLQEAGLDATVLEPFAATQEYCDQVALLIARGYLDGQTSWLAADDAINHLYPVMLACSAIPDCAWGIYEAFDAGEYHPNSPTLSDDEVTKSILLPQVGSWRAQPVIRGGRLRPRSIPALACTGLFMGLEEKNLKHSRQAAYARFVGVACGVAITSALVGMFQLQHGVLYIIVGGSFGLGAAFAAWFARRAS